MKETDQICVHFSTTAESNKELSHSKTRPIDIRQIARAGGVQTTILTASTRLLLAVKHDPGQTYFNNLLATGRLNCWVVRFVERSGSGNTCYG